MTTTITTTPMITTGETSIDLFPKGEYVLNIRPVAWDNVNKKLVEGTTNFDFNVFDGSQPDSTNGISLANDDLSVTANIEFKGSIDITTGGAYDGATLKTGTYKLTLGLYNLDPGKPGYDAKLVGKYVWQFTADTTTEGVKKTIYLTNNDVKTDGAYTPTQIGATVKVNNMAVFEYVNGVKDATNADLTAEVKQIATADAAAETPNTYAVNQTLFGGQGAYTYTLNAFAKDEAEIASMQINSQDMLTFGNYAPTEMATGVYSGTKFDEAFTSTLANETFTLATEASAGTDTLTLDTAKGYGNDVVIVSKNPAEDSYAAATTNLSFEDWNGATNTFALKYAYSGNDLVISTDTKFYATATVKSDNTTLGGEKYAAGDKINFELSYSQTNSRWQWDAVSFVDATDD